MNEEYAIKFDAGQITIMCKQPGGPAYDVGNATSIEDALGKIQERTLAPVILPVVTIAGR